MKRLQLAISRSETVETLSGRTVRVNAIDFDGTVWASDVRDGSSLKLRPFSFGSLA